MRIAKHARFVYGDVESLHIVNVDEIDLLIEGYDLITCIEYSTLWQHRVEGRMVIDPPIKASCPLEEFVAMLLVERASQTAGAYKYNW